jgi:hypothetical protein
MKDDYSTRQSAKDAEYARQYKAWIKSLTPDERRKLEAQGLAAPDLARHGNGSAKGDAADSPLMRDGDDPALMPEPEAEPEPDFHCAPSAEPHQPIRDTEAAWSTARHVLGEVLNHCNARLTAECIALVSGLIYSGDSMTAIAKRHGISRAAVSKRCVELTELLNLRPSRAMRSLTARKSYRSARIHTTQSHEITAQTHQPQSHRQPRRDAHQR